LGSNLESPTEQVERGIAALDELPQSGVYLRSALFCSAPMGPTEQPDFVNAVVALMTRLSAHELLSKMQAIELAQGRQRGPQKWGPRTLDLDLLAFSNLTLSKSTLTLPHPGIAERNFVLLPWREITPYFKVPGSSTIEMLASRAPDEPRIQKII
jgi:2-amino-4-hydroxy-6-hydroxymethyldihydropteridine diphosphokinase